MAAERKTRHRGWLNGLRLNTRHLQLVLTLYEHRNMTIGAASLGMAQPAASRLLSTVERETGAQLFRRLPRGLEVTEAGQAFVHRIRAIGAELHEAGFEIAAMQQGRSGIVSFGCSGGTIAHALPAIEIVQREHPKLELQIHVETSDVLATLVQERRLEFALGRIPRNVDPAPFLYHRQGDGRTSFICREGHPLLHRPGLQPRDLLDHVWVLPPVHAPVRQWLNRFFLSRGLPAPERVIVNQSASIELAVGLVALTDALSILAETTAALFCAGAGCKVIPLNEDCTTSPFGIFWLRERPLSPSAATAVAAIRTAMATSPLKGPRQVERPIDRGAASGLVELGRSDICPG